VRNMFAEFYRPDDDAFVSLWQDGVVVLDASVLLDFYKYSETTLEETFSVLRALADSERLWLPYQAALEYHRQRPTVIVAQETEQYDVAYLALAKLKKAADELRDKLGQHAYLDPDETVAILDRAAQDFEAHLKQAREDHPDFRQSDSIRSTLDDLYEGRVGQPWADQRLAEVATTGKDRYARAVPPGYADAEKPAHLRFGDLVFWLQTLEFAKTNSTDVIVVTNDSKEDWWIKPKGQLFGPRAELRAEFHAETGREFYMYSHDRFMTWAADYLEIGVDQESIDEIRDVRESNETNYAWNDVSSRGVLAKLLAQNNFVTTNFSNAIATGMKIPDYSTIFSLPNVPDFSKVIGKVNFPEYPNLFATINIPDYSKFLANMATGIYQAAETSREVEELPALEEGEATAEPENDGAPHADSEPAGNVDPPNASADSSEIAD
jgi:hypothetical protein